MALPNDVRFANVDDNGENKRRRITQSRLCDENACCFTRQKVWREKKIIERTKEGKRKGHGTIRESIVRFECIACDSTETSEKGGEK